MNNTLINPAKAISRDQWLNARKELLIREKQLTRLRDEIDRQHRALPCVKIEKTYTFDGSDGQRTLSDLFEGRSQLIVSHFMFGPGWKEGCVGLLFPIGSRGWCTRPSGTPRALPLCRSPLAFSVGVDVFRRSGDIPAMIIFIGLTLDIRHRNFLYVYCPGTVVSAS
jgi:Bacterial protein of unknown function (DUF899)